MSIHLFREDLLFLIRYPGSKVNLPFMKKRRSRLRLTNISVNYGTEIVKLFKYVPGTKIAEFSNSVDLTEVAHNEPPHLDIHCLLSSL